MRNVRAIRYALLGVVSQSPAGIHGYALKRQCERTLGEFWHFNLGEIYRMLERLAEEVLIEQVPGQPGSTRKLYRITDKGRQALDVFTIERPTDVPHPLRQELAVKLAFARPDRLPEVVRLIDQQREAYMGQLNLLGVQRRKLRRSPIDSFITNLLVAGAELHARAELTWLDEVTQKLRERFAAVQ